MKKIILLTTIISILLVLTTEFVQAQHDVEVYFFYGNTCPYCAQAKPFLENLKASRDWLNVKYYEVYDNQVNAMLFDEFLKAYNQNLAESGVPAFFVDTDLMMGFNENVVNMVEHKIDVCHATGCVSPLGVLQKKIPADGQVVKSKSFGTGWFIFLALMVLIVVIIFLLKQKKPNKQL